MRRLLPALLLVAAVACGSDGGDEDLPTAAEVSTTSTSTVAGSTTGTTGGGTPTTVDLDGVEPDAVEPPPVDGVPTTAQPSTSSTRTALPGFGEVVIEVTRVDGEVVEWCLLLAETAAQTQRGLMEVTDPGLGGYDGMLFRFEEPHDGGFYMRNTPQELDIAYLDTAGDVVSRTTMTPCEDVEGCPSYPAGGPFVRTVEVPVAAGGLAGLGIDDGAVVVDTGRTCST